jgi:ribonuclease J
VHKGNAKVHVSGHASAGELVYCYNIVKPANVLPVHGEWRHLKANADLAISTGVHPDRALIAEDGSVIDLVDGIASITGQVPASLVFVDAMTVGGATEESLTVRRNLAEEGVVTIVALADPDTGKLTEKPDFLAHGFEHDESTFDSAVPVIQRVLTKASKDDIDVEQTEELIKQAVSTWAHRTYRRSPLIIPVVIDA